MGANVEKVTELPVGEYNAVRVLRHALQQAERGDIKTVVIICTDGMDIADQGQDIWAVWSDGMAREQVLWCQRWFNSWLNKRYFGDYHD